MADLGVLEYIKLGVYYASYLYFPAAALLLWLAVRRKGALRLAAAACLIAASCIAYGRFVEPRILLAADHDIALKSCADEKGAARIAVVSDIHAGLFANAMPVRRISARLEAANPDLVLIAGDFIYFPDTEKLEQTFAPFTVMRAPVYAVLGNHDIGLPGPDVSEALNSALPRAGVTLIENKSVKVSGDGFEFELVGLSDKWGRMQDLSLLTEHRRRPRLVLTHNPTTIEKFRPGMRADLLIGGHTHGGQIQLPLLTCVITGVCGDSAYGLREEAGVSIFTTSGTGMSGLPMRFRAPPRIDILTVSYRACADVENSF